MSMCNGKQKYDSKNQAKRVMYTAEKYRGRELRIYECPKCHSWRLTSERASEHV